MTKTGQEGFNPFAIGQLPAFEVTGDSLVRAADFLPKDRLNAFLFWLTLSWIKHLSCSA